MKKKGGKVEAHNEWKNFPQFPRSFSVSIHCLSYDCVLLAAAKGDANTAKLFFSTLNIHSIIAFDTNSIWKTNKIHTHTKCEREKQLDSMYTKYRRQSRIISLQQAGEHTKYTGCRAK